MRLSVDKLSHQLNQGLPSVLLLCGNEVLLIEEALDLLRATARNNGFTERLSYTVAAGFDWNEVGHAEQTMSLFAESRIIELRMSAGRPSDKGQFILDFVDNVNDAQKESNDILIIITDMLTAQQRKSKWISAIENGGWLIDCYDVKSEQFPNWVKQRLQSRALRVELGVVQLLSHTMEGNLLAAAQTIEQLKTLATDGAVTLELLEKTIADQSRFSAYSLVDSCLLGDAESMMHRLRRLRGESDVSVLLVWSLAKELRELYRMSVKVKSGSSINDVMREYRVWSNRQRMISSALKRLSNAQFARAVKKVTELDLIVKGQRYGDAWFEIEKLCLYLCGVDTLHLEDAVQPKAV